MERNGLYVNKDLIELQNHKHIDKDNKIYTEYNPYTATGRPSSRFGGINFAALNKKDESRKCFKSRFNKDGFLIEYDYDAYHLRLIANIIGYNLPNGSVHEYLGKQYGVDYEESKAMSFKLLYGGIDKDIAKSIPFFGKVQHFIDEKWSEFNKNNYVKTNIYSRRIHKDNIIDVTKNKLFNYIIQAHETETNIKTIIDLKYYLLNRKTKLVLYGYDSFLFDIHKDDRVQVFRELRNILERNGHLTKIKAGKNYGEMVNITEKI